MTFLIEFFGTIREILFGVYQKPSLLWQIIPLIALWITLEIYFGRYKKEKLGWNTALGNGITLFWIVISSIQFIFFESSSFKENWALIIGVFVIGLYSLSVIYISFKHSLKEKWTYFLASSTPIYYFSIIALLLAHKIIFLNLSSLLAIFIMFVVFATFFSIVRLFIPKSKKLDDSMDDSLETDFTTPKSKKSKKDDLDFSSDFPPSDLEKELNTPPASQEDPFAQSPPPQTNNTSFDPNQWK